MATWNFQLDKLCRYPLWMNSLSQQHKVSPPSLEVPSAELQSATAESTLDLHLLPAPLSSSFFGRDSLNEVFVLCLKLQTPLKRSSIKTLPSSAPCRNLRHTNFHWISGMLRLNSLAIEAQVPSKGRRRLEGLSTLRQMMGQTGTERQRQAVLTFNFYTLFMGQSFFENSNSSTVSTD